MSTRDVCSEKCAQLERDIGKIVHVVLLGAIREQIEQHGSWSLRTDDVAYSKFYDNVAKKHEIQVCAVEKHDNIEVDFEMLGSLANLFKQHKFAPTMHATVQNCGNDYVEFREEIDLELDLDRPSTPVYSKPSQKHLDKLSGLHEELSKKYLFALVSQ